MRLTHPLVPLLVLTAVAPACRAADTPAPPAPVAPAQAREARPAQRPDRFGAITEVHNNTYTLNSRQGTVTVTIPAATPIEGFQGASASSADLKVGARIGVYGEAKPDGTFLASRVVVLPSRPAGAGRGGTTAAVRPVTPPAPANGLVYPQITLDTSGAPDLSGFAERAKAICEAFYPPISAYLKTDGFTPPRAFKVIFQDMDGVAYTSGDEIHCAAKYFREHPDDYGAVVHEMTHVIQHYTHGDNPGWLVEALDDYVRFYRYEPAMNTPHADPNRVGDTPEAYRVGAQFLDWTQTRYDKDLVPQLNAAMRDGVYSDAIWKDKTGQTLAELWGAWKASLRTAAPVTTTAAAARNAG